MKKYLLYGVFGVFGFACGRFIQTFLDYPVLYNYAELIEKSMRGVRK